MSLVETETFVPSAEIVPVFKLVVPLVPPKISYVAEPIPLSFGVNSMFIVL